MDKNTYLAGIGALYAAEVLGEGLASRWLELTSDPGQKYKLSLFLQLESESKVKLRPLLARHGLSLVEDEKQRAAGAAVAERFASVPWQEAMATLADLALPYVLPLPGALWRRLRPKMCRSCFSWWTTSNPSSASPRKKPPAREAWTANCWSCCPIPCSGRLTAMITNGGDPTS